jgi:hypothetical protein
MDMGTKKKKHINNITKFDSSKRLFRMKVLGIPFEINLDTHFIHRLDSNGQRIEKKRIYSANQKLINFEAFNIE